MSHVPLKLSVLVDHKCTCMLPHLLVRPLLRHSFGSCHHCLFEKVNTFVHELDAMQYSFRNVLLTHISPLSPRWNTRSLPRARSLSHPRAPARAHARSVALPVAAGAQSPRVVPGHARADSAAAAAHVARDHHVVLLLYTVPQVRPDAVINIL
jgi:hypothetical protein